MTAWGEVPRSSGTFTAILIGDCVGDAEAAIVPAGGRVGDRIGWDGVDRVLSAETGQPVLVVEATSADDATLATALPRIADAIERLALRAVVTLDIGQIDRIAAVLMGERVQLLCNPTMAERVTALAIAAELTQRTVLHDRVSEGEATRLAKLNEEVARIAEVLARLSRREDDTLRRGDVADRRQPFELAPAAEAGQDPVAAVEIRRTIRARRLRDRHFAAGLFEDPGWDILLDLYAAHLERAQVSVSSLCIAAAVAPTTALRWITKMADAGLLERQPDPFDRRRAFMALSVRALEGMRGYIATAQAQGLPIV